MVYAFDFEIAQNSKSKISEKSHLNFDLVRYIFHAVSTYSDSGQVIWIRIIRNVTMFL